MTSATDSYQTPPTRSSESGARSATNRHGCGRLLLRPYSGRHRFLRRLPIREPRGSFFILVRTADSSSAAAPGSLDSRASARAASRSCSICSASISIFWIPRARKAGCSSPGGAPSKAVFRRPAHRPQRPDDLVMPFANRPARRLDLRPVEAHAVAAGPGADQQNIDIRAVRLLERDAGVGDPGPAIGREGKIPERMIGKLHAPACAPAPFADRRCRRPSLHNRSVKE